MGDADVLRAIAAGDLTALGLLYDRYAEDVRRFVQRATSHAEDGEDLTHEVFLTVLKVAASYDGRAVARPFLIGIAARHVHRRRRGVRRLAEVLSQVARSLATPSPRTPEQVSCTAQELRAFERALGRLSEEKRLVFLMVEGEGLPGEDVARELGIPVATVRTRLHHARKEIRAAMSRGSRE